MRTTVFFILLLALVAGNQAYGQKKNKKVFVSGFVPDINNQPVSGAMILVDKMKSDIVTDSKGFFKIKIKPDVKMIGAFTFDKGSGETLLDRKPIDPGLTPVITIVLDGPVAMKGKPVQTPDSDEKINIGYGTINKKDLSSGSNQIDATEDRFSSYTNIYDMIRGEIPGVQVTGNKIVIRGINSINASSDPLFVVDGIVVSSIDNINPRQVKTINVLKGSDAAIYGSRGANGVILIDQKGADNIMKSRKKK